MAAPRRQVATDAAELEYWLDRASGRSSAADPGWYFSGRADLTRAVAGFLTGGDGLLVVTGAAGTGKSAVIARAVTLSDPAVRDRYGTDLVDVDPVTLPPIGSVDVAVLARNKEPVDVLTQLVQGLVADSESPAPGVDRAGQLRNQTHRIIAERSRPDGRAVTVVVEGLDEATRPERVVSDVLGPLSRLADPTGRPLIRFVVGVRSPRPGGPDPTGDGGEPSARDGAGLLDLLLRATAGRAPTVLRTDGPDAQADIDAYVAALLARGTGRYATDRDGRARAAAVIAASVQPSFLDARLAAGRLSDDPAPTPLDDPTWLASLSEGTIGQLRLDLADLATDQHPPEHLLAVLRAAAFALGGGIPWADIWPAMVSAVGGRPVPDPDEVIRHVLAGRLSGYLTRDVEDGRVVHRPAHDRLAVVLRDTRSQLLATKPARDQTARDGDDLDRDDQRGVHARAARALADLVPLATDVPPHPYLRRHLVRHAVLGGVLNDRVVPSRLLPWKASGTVRGSLGLPLTAEAARTMLGALLERTMNSPRLAG